MPVILAATLALLPPEDHPPEPFLDEAEPVKVELVVEAIDLPTTQAIDHFTEVVETEVVRLKQEHLADLGWYRGEVDGIRGPLTEEALSGFATAAEVGEVTLPDLTADGAPEAPPPPEPAPTQASSGSESGIASHWLALADCESGEWDANANPIPGSRRWDYGAPGAFSRPSYPFHGGLNFEGSTWTWVAPMVGLGHIDRAYQATPQEQVRVAEKTQELQGWRAWPTCSRKIGLR